MRRKLPEVLQRLERGGLETSTHATTGEGDAVLAAHEAVERGFDVVIAAGGDGTLNEVINGLAEQPYRPKLGILPLGTTNDFARALGIPRNFEAACDLITRNQTVPIDIGKVNEKYFINIAGGGSLTELTYEVPSRLKTVLGQLAYYVKGLEKLPSFKPIKATIETDTETIEEEIMLFLASNSNSVGGFEKLVPDASLNDGKLDLILLRKCNLAEFIRIVTSAMRGDHLNDPHLKYIRTSKLNVTSPDYVQLNLDGEYGGTLPVNISVLPSHLEVFADESGQFSYKTGSRHHQIPPKLLEGLDE